MPQVPYSPVPTVAPTEQGLPSVHVDTPVAAFGGAVGAGLSHVGTAMEQAGNELFGRAVALQQLNNETEAREADAKYMMDAGDLHANYNALQGKDRVDAFPKYHDDLNNLRTKIRGGLSNPMAQKMYDSSSLSTMSRSIFNGAGAAAAANKEWTVGTLKSQMDIDLKTIEDDPSETTFNDKLSRIQNSAHNLSAQMGLGSGSAQEQDLVLKATSKAWAQRIIGTARTKPFEAIGLLDANKTQLTSDDYLKVDNIVRAQGRAVGSVNIANDIYSPDKTLGAMEGEARDKAGKVNPDDPLLAEHAVQAVRSHYNQDHHARKLEEAAAKDTVAGLIQQHQPKTMQEFMTLPGADVAVQRLTPTEQNAIPAQINRYNSAVDKYSNEETMTRLKGMSVSDDPEARAAFLDLDPTKEKLSQPQMRQVMDMQRKMKAQTEGDPRVQKAIGYMKGAMGSQLEALGVYRRTEANKEDYDHYIGTLQSALDVWNETHGKPATYKDITDTIGPQILRQRTEPYFFGLGSTQTPFFKQTVPEDFATRARAIAENPNLPDEQIYKLWTRMQYQNFYAKPPAKDQGRVGQ